MRGNEKENAKEMVFICYIFFYSNGNGCVQIWRDKKINSLEQFNDVRNFICKENNLKNVAIINIMLICKKVGNAKPLDKAEIKAKAYKECIEKVKKLWGMYRGYEFEIKLYSLLNELVGDTSAEKIND